ncbi:hypothetical protein [Nannocystis pusilla]|uniref:hypothetical protein n=1 Tax=Nannocystis pusilla TaxID=889268 RepID=UPI003B7A9088
MLAREGQQAGLVLRDFGGAEHDAQLFVTLGDALELGAQGRVHGERATLAPGRRALKGHAAAAGADEDAARDDARKHGWRRAHVSAVRSTRA